MLMSLQPSGQMYKQLVPSPSWPWRPALGAWRRGPGRHEFFAFLPPDADVDKIQAQWLDLVEGHTTKPFEEGELTRVHDIAVNSYRQQMKRTWRPCPADFGLDRGRRPQRLLFQLMEDIPR